MDNVAMERLNRNELIRLVSCMDDTEKAAVLTQIDTQLIFAELHSRYDALETFKSRVKGFLNEEN